MTTLDLRGRDLVIIPEEEMLRLPTPELLQALFGEHLPADIRATIGRDKRYHFLRTLPLNFNAVKQALRQQHTPFSVAFDERPALPFVTSPGMQPRPYQQEALNLWLAQNSAGVVILPTGAGKTFVAAMAIPATGLWTIVIVPTIDLLQQWRAALAPALSISSDTIGIFGGGEKDLQPITIITYDSAALYPGELRHFGLLIFDECQHLPAPTYRQIAESAFTPLRLGLSATPERGDMGHADLGHLIGPEVYRRSPAELTAGRYLARYQEVRIDVALSRDEERYARQRRRIVFHSPEEFQQKLIFLSARDPEARAAMLAWHEARNIALNSPAKYAEIEWLLHQHASDQVILFSEYNRVVNEISRRFCLPSMTCYMG